MKYCLIIERPLEGTIKNRPSYEAKKRGLVKKFLPIDDRQGKTSDLNLPIIEITFYLPKLLHQEGAVLCPFRQFDPREKTQIK